MTSPQDPHQYIHRAAVDAEGNRIGKISQVYLDDNTGQPLWVLESARLQKAKPGPVQVITLTHSLATADAAARSGPPASTSPAAET
jgi:hypothetical protein